MASIRLSQYPRDVPPQEPPLRQPTLESQRGSLRVVGNIWARLLSRRPQTLDNFERVLAERTANAQDGKELSNVCRDYRWLKLRHGAQISRGLIWYKAFGPFAPSTLHACE